MQVQLITGISLIITVTPTHPTPPGQVYCMHESEQILLVERRLMVIGCFLVIGIDIVDANGFTLSSLMVSGRKAASSIFSYSVKYSKPFMKCHSFLDHVKSELGPSHSQLVIWIQ